MPKFSVMLARFPGNSQEHPDSSDWIADTYHKAKTDPRFDRVIRWRKSDTPIDMVRNECVEVAKAAGVDILVMLDSDMSPDTPGIPGAKPFWDSTIDFMLQHDGPCVVAAPYVGPPPYEPPYVFRWVNGQTNNPNPDMRLEMFSREDAATRAGFEEVAALPTGLIAIDMRCFELLKPPYFYYEWSDAYQHTKATTEDVAFTRDASLAGIPQYCNWDAWAGHWKLKCCRKPQLLKVDDVRKAFRDALLSGRKRGEAMRDVNAGVPAWKQRFPKPCGEQKPQANPRPPVPPAVLEDGTCLPSTENGHVPALAGRKVSDK